MTREEIGLLAVRGSALALLIVSGIGLFVGILHAVETKVFFPPSVETMYRTTYIGIEILGKAVAMIVAGVLLKRSEKVASWLLKKT